jgi:putative transposase
MGTEARDRIDLHPAWEAPAERLRRALQPNCRHEWLDLYIFNSITEVQEIATEWLWTYNHEWPNMGIGGITSAHKLKMAA